MKISIVMEALTGKFVTDTKRASKQFQREMKDMEQEAQARGAAIGAALAAAAAAVAFAMKQAIDEADKLGETAEKLGLTAEAFTSMGYAAQMSGIEIDKFATANRNLGLRLEKNEELFATLGVATRDAEGRYRSTTDIIRDLADAFAEMPEGVEQSRVAAELFGAKLGNEMIPFLNRGSDGVRQLENDAKVLGFTLSDDAAGAAGEFNDALDRTKAMIGSVLRSAIGPLNEALRFTVGMFIALKTQALKALEVLKYTASAIGDIVSTQIRQFERLGTIMSLPAQIATKGLEGGFTAWRNALSNYRQEAEAQLPRIGVQFAQLAGRLNKIDEEGFAQFDAFMRTGGGQAGTGAVVDLPTDDAATGGGTGRSMARDRSGESEADSKRAEAKRKLADALLAEAEARRIAKEQAAEARKQEREYAEQMISDMEFELELMRMSNVEQQTAIQLRGMSAEAVKLYGEEIAALNKRMEEQAKLTSLMDETRYAAKNLFSDLISGSKSAGDAIKDFADSILASIQNMIVDNFVQSLFGGFGQTGGGMFGGGIGGFFSSLFGFGGGRANGGGVLPGRMYRVNEEGPEMLSVGGRDYLMMGNNAGMVTPNHRMGRSVNQNITFMLPGRVDTRTQAQIAADAGRAANRAIARN